MDHLKGRLLSRFYSQRRFLRFVRVVRGDHRFLRFLHDFSKCTKRYRVVNDLRWNRIVRVNRFARFFSAHIASTTFQRVRGPTRTRVVKQVRSRTRVDRSIFSLFTIMRLTSTGRLMESVQLRRVLLSSAQLNIHPMRRYRVTMLTFIFTSFLLRLQSSMTHFIVFKLTPMMGSVLTIQVVDPRLFFFPVSIILSRVVNYARSFFNKTVILLRRSRFYVQVVLFRIRSILRIDATPAMSTLIHVTSSTSIFRFINRRLRRLMLNMINVLMFIRVSMVRFVLMMKRHF